MAEKEWVYAPNPLEALDIVLPEALLTQTHQETHKLLITLWLESFVSCPSEAFKKAFIETFSSYWTQEFPQIQKLDSDYIHGKLAEALLEFRTANPEEYQILRWDNSVSYIIFNGVSINFHTYFEEDIVINEDIWGLQKSLRPKPRPDITQLIWTSIPLSRYYEIVGFWEKLESSINLLFSERLWKESLTSSEKIQVMKLLKFVLWVETFWGENIVLEDNIARPSWFYQFQVKDGSFWKEVYDFKTQTWKNNGKWTPEDREVKITKWDDKIWVRKIRKYSSYEQALLSLSDSLKGEYPALLEQERTIWNPNLQHPENLTHEEQTILFLSNIISKGGIHSRELFTRILAWDDTAIIELYRKIHHADKKREDTLKTVQNVALETLGISYEW